jgi:mannose-6-phosphate isomerase-like protein (cupin superfamily)
MIERANETAFDWPVYDSDNLIGTQWYFLEESALPVAIQAWMLEPGQSEGGHTHDEDHPLEEFYLVISGEAEVTLEGEKSILGPGDAILAKTGVDHDIRNSGSAPLHLIVVWGKPGTTEWESFRMGKAAKKARGTEGPQVWA